MVTVLSISNIIPIVATTVENMFDGCGALTLLDLRGWEFKFDATSVDADQLFANCSNLEYIYVSSLWDSSKVAEAVNMFTDDESLPNFDETDVSGAKAYAGDGGYLTLR